MKQIYLTLFTIVFFTFLKGQSSVLKIQKNFDNANIIYLAPTKIEPELDGNAPFKLSLGASELKLRFDEKEITEFILILPYKNSFFYQSVFISKNDSIVVNIDTCHDTPIFNVSGKDISNNKGFTFSHSPDTKSFDNDTVPLRLLKYLDELHKKEEANLKAYIQKHSPTDDFVSLGKNNLSYAKVDWFLTFYNNHKFKLKKLPNHETLISKWEAKKDSLVESVKLNNEKALNSYHYLQFITRYINIEKNRIWELEDKEDVFNVLYSEFPKETRKVVYESDMENLLLEKLINKQFTGNVNEYLYANLLTNMRTGMKTNLTPIFERFHSNYPNSKFLPLFTTMANDARLRNSNKISKKMTLIENTDSIKTFEHLLHLYAGKNILLDMWGTWCGPCHEEIEKNGAELKKYFQNSSLEFIYISNYDKKNIQRWKQLIAYYEMEGTHILASQELTEDILKKTGARGFPSYIIIRKDGTFELSKAGYPMDRELLIKQIDDNLKLQ